MCVGVVFTDLGGGGETSISCLPHPLQGLNLQPGNVPDWESSVDGMVDGMLQPTEPPSQAAGIW